MFEKKLEREQNVLDRLIHLTLEIYRFASSGEWDMEQKMHAQNAGGEGLTTINAYTDGTGEETRMLLSMEENFYLATLTV